MQKRFVILDGSSLMYRSFFALPLLTSSKGEYTNAIYGFATMLIKLIQDLKPDLLVIAFDKGKKTFRNDLFEDYKGTRKATPLELSSQIPRIHELANVFGITLIEKEGFEADDIIGTLATAAAKKDYESMIVTGDHDALQLIQPNLKVMMTKRGISDMEIFDEVAFKEKYNLKPTQLIDLKGLMGDASDNIPGVPGVGEKTATRLLIEYGTMENVLNHIDDISGKKLKERLSDNKEQAVLSKRLATIVCDVPIDFVEKDYTIIPKHEEIKAFCSQYELKNIPAKVDRLFPQMDALGFGEIVESTLPQYEVVKEPQQIEKIVADVRLSKKFVFIAITQGHLPTVFFEGMSIKVDEKIFFVSSNLHNWYLLLELLADASIEKFTGDIKPLYHMGLQLSGKIYDVILMAYLLEPAANGYALSSLMDIYLPGTSEPSNMETEIDAAVWDVYCVEKLGMCILEKMKKQEMKRLYDDIELPLVEVLADMEANGIYVNRKHLEVMSIEVNERIDGLLAEIHALAGIEFNVNSPKQLGEVLFDRLFLPAVKKTKTGYSTNAEVLETLRMAHPIVEKILDYRLWNKLKTTYLDSLGLLISEKTKRIHTTFNQTVTATGRLSSSDPNLQNIPVRTDAGKKIRELFEPGEGYDYLLSADYSQIELRLLADMSQDKNFVEAFNEEQDIHIRTASEVFGISMAEVTSEIRRKAKAVNFGIVYGISDYGLSKDLHISRKEAAEYINSYFEKCAGVKSFIDKTVDDAHKNGFVTTIFGRKRYLPMINSSNYNQRTLAERMAMNTPIQGSAADIIKLAMLGVYKELCKKKLKSRMLLQVHDELVLEVPEDEVQVVSDILHSTMENVVKLSVPLTIDINKGKNWAEAK